MFCQDVVCLLLGLMIIDEEQSDGVKHKEKLKELKKQVDVLTLTALPIPRKPHMSMLGESDLSVIETPPRLIAILFTYVLEKRMIVSFVMLSCVKWSVEQVYYLYNKVLTQLFRRFQNYRR